MTNTYVFRGYNRQTDKWLYGDLIENRGEIFIAPRGIAPFGAESDNYKVERFSIGQYTRMDDMSGNNVYEDDILLDTATGRRYVVMYNDGMYHAIQCGGPRDRVCSINALYLILKIESVKVVDNIFARDERAKNQASNQG